MLLDYYPETEVILEGEEEELRTVGTGDLFPFAYRHRKWTMRACSNEGRGHESGAS